MNIEQHTTSLELSRRLKELGVEQESIWYWMPNTNNTYGQPDMVVAHSSQPDYLRRKYISAFLASELQEIKFCLQCGSFKVTQRYSSKEYVVVECQKCSHRSRQKRTNFLVDMTSGCWYWMKSKNPDGYGHMMFKNKIVDSYKVFYEVFVGKVSSGHELDHLCRHRNCVNPFHLEPVTHAENSRRGVRRKLTNDQIIQIRGLKGVKTQRELGKMFGVSHTCIGDIWKGKTWSLENNLITNQTKGMR